MSEKFIPEHVDPFRYAEQSLSVVGAVNLEEMQRLGTNLVPVKGSFVKATLQFGVDEQKITYLKGHLEAIVGLQCQRCMEPYNYEIMSDFALAIVSTLDEANALPEQYEPAIAKDGSLALRELIEDEMILNLPIIPRHEPEACKVSLPYADVAVEEGKGKNPFHILESLKQKKHQS